MRVLACGHLNGELDRLQDLRRAVQEEGPNLVVLAGNVLASGSRPPEIATHALHQALHTLATLPCAVALVPGGWTLPNATFCLSRPHRRSERHLHCVYGMFMTASDLAVAGFGGRVTEGERETETALHYPGWEVMYRMAFLGQLEQDLLLIFHHPPAQVHELDIVDGQHTGSEVITELVGTWRQRVVVVAGAIQGRVISTTVVVSLAASIGGSMP
jgi:Icc-related predicted phosphoesterase